jgi:carbonic anhydrase
MLREKRSDERTMIFFEPASRNVTAANQCASNCKIGTSFQKPLPSESWHEHTSATLDAVFESGTLTCGKACAARFTWVAVELGKQGSLLTSKLEDVMSVIDQALKSNEQYAKAYDSRLGAHPQPAIAVVTCMDPRLSDLEGILGLKRADMDVIRNGGPAVTDEVLADLVVSTRVLGSREVMLLNHTGCGFTTFTEGGLNAKLSSLTGDGSPVPMHFHSYKDPVEHTKEQIKKVRSHPWIAEDVPVRGFIFDVDSGRLREVTIDGRQSLIRAIRTEKAFLSR